MDQELRLQRILDRVELVPGVGDRSRGRMCVMSLAACLAGEGHTDSPRSASRLIGYFAIPINDQMPHDVRQRLKPFAPRLIGTNDGLDGERAELLRRTLAEEILPRISGRYGADGAGRRGRVGPLGRMWLRLRRGGIESRIAKLLDEAKEGAHRPGQQAEIARAAGRLIGLCAREAPNAREAEWYWNAAIGLLDRLCDVGAEQRRAAPTPVRADRLDWLEVVLDARRPGTARAATGSVWAGLPGVAWAGDNES